MLYITSESERCLNKMDHIASKKNSAFPGWLEQGIHNQYLMSATASSFPHVRIYVFDIIHFHQVAVTSILYTCRIRKLLAVVTIVRKFLQDSDRFVVQI